MDKQSKHVRAVIALHNLRDRTNEAISSLNEKSLADRLQTALYKTQAIISSTRRSIFSHPDDVLCEHIPHKYAYIFRRKSLWELTLISAAVCGIEFCYAAETAFVTPILLSLGLSMKFVTMFWCLSPLLAFIFTSVLGSLSDSCKSRFGRRRPFIVALSVGIFIGLFLVPYGRQIGMALGDEPFSTHLKVQNISIYNASISEVNFTHAKLHKKDINMFLHKPRIKRILKQFQTESRDALESTENLSSHHSLQVSSSLLQKSDDLLTKRQEHLSNEVTPGNNLQTWSIAFTVLGTILIDFCADVCQSPCRAYLLDVSLPIEHAKGLSTFSFMAGFGAALGYIIGAIRWDVQLWGNVLEAQVIVVFSIITVIFILCLIASLCFFPEIPLTTLKDPVISKEYQEKLQAGNFQGEPKTGVFEKKQREYSSTAQKDTTVVCTGEEVTIFESTGNLRENPIEERIIENDKSSTSPLQQSMSSAEQTRLKDYLKSIIKMPKSLRILCLTNLFCWMSIICYCLYFTDFVGESVYKGDPTAPENSLKYELYKEGVRFGCWGMAFASISCSFYSLFIDKLVKRFGAKPVYSSGGVVFSIGMAIMAILKHPVAVIVLSSTAGIMYTTVFTMPYLLISGYHTRNKFREDGKNKGGVRGIGTDVAAVTSMLVLSQLILSLTVGSIVEAVGSNVVTVYGAALFSACGAISASQVMYLDM